MYTLTDIREELRKPGRDPRDKFVVPQFPGGRKGIEGPAPGMVLEGVVTNVTNSALSSISGSIRTGSFTSVNSRPDT